jgi:hypothetical protein
VGNPPLIVGLLINGAAYAAIFVVVALLVRYFAGAAVWRVLVVATLFVAAGLYVVFALRAGEGTTWIAIEAVGVADRTWREHPGYRLLFMNRSTSRSRYPRSCSRSSKFSMCKKSVRASSRAPRSSGPPPSR